jgi:hypothetical protein
MSRTLSRPMFRLGGSTSGITSGLDSPRKGYNVGGFTDEQLARYAASSQKVADKFFPQQKPNINRFLINWGLNMVGNPPSGNVLQTAARQAQKPTAELFESIDRSKGMRAATGADIFGKVIAAEGEMMGGSKTYKDKLMLDTLIDATKEKIRITKLLETEEDKVVRENLENELILANTTIAQIKKRNPLVDRVLGSTAVVKELLDVILPSYDKMMIKDEESGENVLKYPKTPEGQAKKIQDAMAEIMRIVQAGGTEAQATGGRVGYQGGELVEDINVEETIQPEGMPQQGTPQVDPVGMSFEELRSRLPATITDDIVILLSQSAQALEDFATIQTQQDVDNFNTKYNVNLVLPSEG